MIRVNCFPLEIVSVFAIGIDYAAAAYDCFSVVRSTIYRSCGSGSALGLAPTTSGSVSETLWMTSGIFSGINYGMVSGLNYGVGIVSGIVSRIKPGMAVGIASVMVSGMVSGMLLGMK